MNGDNDNQNPGAAGKIVGGILKKAATIGAGAYVSAEDTFKNTLGSLYLPKEILKEVLEGLIQSHTIQIKAEINFVPKKDKKSEEDKP